MEELMDMAKNNGLDKAISNAIDDVLKDWETSVREGVNFALKQAKNDFMVKANNCLQEYYYNYDPSRYDRTEILQYAFLPYLEIKNSAKKISGQVGIEYSAEMLERFIGEPQRYIGRDGEIKTRHVGYYGSSNYQPVDADWVIDNYLRGVHPATDGKFTYFEIYDSVSPSEKMEEFRKNYGKIFDENILTGLLGQIIKKI